MADPFTGEIRILPYTFAPRDWAFCDGQLISISQNTALFSLYGITYGGNGQTTFALPNMQGRVPLQQGQGPGLSPYSLGQKSGVDGVTLTQAQMPAHTHSVHVTDVNADLRTPANNYLGIAMVPGRGGARPQPAYVAPSNPPSPVSMAGNAVTTAGGSQAHENRQPFLAIQFCACLVGEYPVRN